MISVSRLRIVGGYSFQIGEPKPDMMAWKIARGKFVEGVWTAWAWVIVNFLICQIGKFNLDKNLFIAHNQFTIVDLCS